MYDFTPQEILRATDRLYIRNGIYKYDYEQQIKMINELFNMEAKRMSNITLNVATAGCAFGKAPSYDCGIEYKTDLKKQKRFSGAILYYDKDGTIKRTYIKRVIYSNPATIVFFGDGTKTICKAQEGDTYNAAAGLALCVYKKMVGASALVEVLDDWFIDGCEKKGRTYDISLKDIRKKKENKSKK